LHGEILGQPELVDDGGRALVALLDALPELALVEPGEGGAVLLALVLEDGSDLEPQLFLGHGDQQIGSRHRPLLPRAAIEPDLRSWARVSRPGSVDRLLVQWVPAVRTG